MERRTKACLFTPTISLLNAVAEDREVSQSKYAMQQGTDGPANAKHHGLKFLYGGYIKD